MDQAMDRRTLAAMASFVALIGFLALSAYLSFDKAQTNADLKYLIGPTMN